METLFPRATHVIMKCVGPCSRQVIAKIIRPTESSDKDIVRCLTCKAGTSLENALSGRITCAVNLTASLAMPDGSPVPDDVLKEMRRLFPDGTDIQPMLTPEAALPNVPL